MFYEDLLSSRRTSGSRVIWIQFESMVFRKVGRLFGGDCHDLIRILRILAIFSLGLRFGLYLVHYRVSYQDSQLLPLPIASDGDGHFPVVGSRFPPL